MLYFFLRGFVRILVIRVWMLLLSRHAHLPLSVTLNPSSVEQTTYSHQRSKKKNAMLNNMLSKVLRV
ncbi:hypothetical protein PS941_03221 [Pseudomonas fluorescens]|uniref:Uncharacterized protein n=1 Tax=Pseudomonas fluorescens TaxID=294 RepID=A0A5E7U8D3_PSEFL|nr:hypothetical protein PS941_03221 [Pseudomonas fluorescens]